MRKQPNGREERGMTKILSESQVSIEGKACAVVGCKHSATGATGVTVSSGRRDRSRPVVFFRLKLTDF